MFRTKHISRIPIETILLYMTNIEGEKLSKGENLNTRIPEYPFML